MLGLLELQQFSHVTAVVRLGEVVARTTRSWPSSEGSFKPALGKRMAAGMAGSRGRCGSIGGGGEDWRGTVASRERLHVLRCS
ncbi:hypothetical protein CATMQ487_25270 [Sphaerotilus microaerophilus]|uniref:Uncharacterized protein n=1 Tax=Sphaerotilus microaerophilus TaxID=2914710 RepID=A0ABM7YM81_9BURK|nr:hypothetical protein CATMQ487_25270 [Sphaerotilus sp. FB-5]